MWMGSWMGIDLGDRRSDKRCKVARSSSFSSYHTTVAIHSISEDCLHCASGLAISVTPKLLKSNMFARYDSKCQCRYVGNDCEKSRFPFFDVKLGRANYYYEVLSLPTCPCHFHSRGCTSYACFVYPVICLTMPLERRTSMLN